MLSVGGLLNIVYYGWYPWFLHGSHVTASMKLGGLSRNTTLPLSADDVQEYFAKRHCGQLFLTHELCYYEIYNVLLLLLLWQFTCTF